MSPIKTGSVTTPINNRALTDDADHLDQSITGDGMIRAKWAHGPVMKVQHVAHLPPIITITGRQNVHTCTV